MILKGEAVYAASDKDPPRMHATCHIFLVSIGSLFGAVILLISGLFVEDSSGSRIIAVLNDIKGSVERVEQKVDVVGTDVKRIGRDIQGMGSEVEVRDISGRSGTGKIGDDAVFHVSMANENLMKGATCRLRLGKRWEPLVAVLDPSCEQFTVRLPRVPILDSSGNFEGDVVQIPFEMDIVGPDSKVMATYKNNYSFHNNYRTIAFKLEPSGNRFKLNERRNISVDVGQGQLTDGVECEWTVFAPLSFEATSPNRCSGVLSTQADPGSYPYKRVIEKGEVRKSLSVQVVSKGDFKMLGIADLKYSITP